MNDAHDNGYCMCHVARALTAPYMVTLESLGMVNPDDYAGPVETAIGMLVDDSGDAAVAYAMVSIGLLVELLQSKRLFCEVFQDAQDFLRDTARVDAETILKGRR